MGILFVGELPVEIEAWLATRREHGVDDFDEVWDGVLHIPPLLRGAHGFVVAELMSILHPYIERAGLRGGGHCAIGSDEDYRVPDMVALRERDLDPASDLTLSAAIVVEVTLPKDESRLKFDFYHRHGVDEVLIVDPYARTAEWFARGPQAFEPADGSMLLGITSNELAAAIDWPL